MSKKYKRYGLITLILFICYLPIAYCFPTWYNLVPGLRVLSFNYVNRVMGEAELVLSSSYNIINARVSPDGKWLLANRNSRLYPSRTILVNLETRELYYVVNMYVNRMQWLDAHHIVSSPAKILRVPDIVWWELDLTGTQRPNPTSLEGLDEAEHIFVLIRYGGGASLVSTDPNLPYQVGMNWYEDEAAAHLADRPHTIIRVHRDCPEGVVVVSRQDCQRVYSPDGRYYVEKAIHPTDPRFPAQKGHL